MATGYGDPQQPGLGLLTAPAGNLARPLMGRGAPAQAPQSPANAMQAITDRGAPAWASAGSIPTLPGAGSGANLSYGEREIADVHPGIDRINVADPGAYTPSVAAHEATHIFQGTRNGDFQSRTAALLPAGPLSPKAYDYGGVAGLQANPRKTISDYNPEQQAQMVEDLTKAQDALRSHMSPRQLQQWDNTKNTLERPIQQLTSIAPKDTSLAGRADDWLADRPELGVDHPFTRLKGLFSPPKMTLPPQPVPSAPSAALGYANRSKLVR